MVTVPMIAPDKPLINALLPPSNDSIEFSGIKAKNNPIRANIAAIWVVVSMNLPLAIFMLFFVFSLSFAGGND